MVRRLPQTAMFLIAFLGIALTFGAVRPAKPTATAPGSNLRLGAAPLQPNSLCATSERIIFSCLSRRAGSKLTKIVSLCGSPDLTRERGYLQYRYGVPAKIELEYPNSRAGTQQMFKYTHYMRYRVDLTEINFELDGYQYQIFDDYNGEEKRDISTQGVLVTEPGQGKEFTFLCRSKVKADFSLLDEVLDRER